MQSQNMTMRARLTGVRAIRTIDRALAKVVEGLAALGTVMIAALMSLICADIVFRNLLGSSLPLISELGGMTLVMIVYLQLAATVRADRLARTEIFLPMFNARFPLGGKLLAAAFNLLGAYMIGLIAWSTLRILERDYSSGEFIGVPGIATLPTWPFQVLILLGITVAAVEFILRGLCIFAEAAADKDAAKEDAAKEDAV